jgi:amino acid adenylation domain-containing protein
VIFEEVSLTYIELNRRANRLAHYLRRLGVRPDDRVAICLDRGIEMIVSLLAVLKAGGASVSLEQAYPAERLRYLLEDSVPVVLLTERHLAGRFADQSLPVVLDVADSSFWSDQESNPDRKSIDLMPEHLAYVIYTSGSTGQPKGVAMPHRALTNLVWWQIKESSRSSAPRTLQFAALGFDISFQEIFSTLCAAGTVVLIKEEQRLNPIELVQLIRASQIQRLFLPYAALQIAVEGWKKEIEAQKEDGIVGFDLREIITAGDQLRIDANILAFFKNLTNCSLTNQYGPTEAHVVTSLNLPLDQREWPNLPSIGRPIANTRIYILDKNRNPVPVGVAGEIYISGAGVARGYLNRPELTAEYFLKDPFSVKPNARMYKTGDLARYLSDGNIEFLGRNDFQVKVRGYRIELGEIESRLAEHLGVRDVVVVVREDQPGDKRLVAYYTTNAGSVEQVAEITNMALRSRLATVLPEYMVPSAYVRLEQLPLTPNGKLNPKALPIPEADAYSSLGYEAPQGEVEKVLAGMWSEILNFDGIGRYDNFFELGGHSLLAVRLLSQIHRALSAEMTIGDIFTWPVLADFAAAMNARAVSRHDDPSPESYDPLNRVLLLRKGTNRSTLFCVHPGGGLSWSYAGLLPYIPEVFSIYGLQAWNYTEPSWNPRTLEEVSIQYLSLIQQQQPYGPYYLLGWSYGGLVAAEMASRLEREGQEVALLALLDSYPFHSMMPSGSSRDNDARILHALLASLGYDERKIVSLPRPLDRSTIAAALYKDDHFPNLALSEVEQVIATFISMFETNIRLAYGYKPSFLLHTNTVLFVATEDNPDLEDAARQWQPYVAGKIAVHPVPARHMQMTKPDSLAIIGPIIAEGLKANDTSSHIAWKV